MTVPESPEVAGVWLEALRARLLSVARRRVQPHAAEDIVQDTLRILLEKGLRGPGSEIVEGVAPMAYAFRVLRNVIGNHYQRERVRGRVHAPPAAGLSRPASDPTPLEALASDEAIGIVESCLDRMRDTDAACARYLRRLIEGRTPRDLAGEEKITEPVLYRRVYRCRLKLRALLAERGIFA